MNEFVEQFLLESREHVEQATADLLALEKTPDDKERVDNVFRAFHTLKGSAGIVDFDAMAAAVHAAENVLSGVRARTRSITTRLIGDCLTCLDQVAQWLDIMESTGELPTDAEVQARAVAARFDDANSDGAHAVTLNSAQTSTPTSAQSGQPESQAWVAGLLAKHPLHGTVSEAAITAIRYMPDANCFYQGADPLARIAALPGLLAVDIEPAVPWSPLDELDPFVCNMIVTALTKSPRADVIDALGDALAQCDIQTLADANEAGAAHSLSLPARELLAAQMALIAGLKEEGNTQGMAGRLASAGIVAANVLLHARLPAEAERMLRAQALSLAQRDPRLLTEAISAVLNAAVQSAAAASAAVSASAPSAEQDTTGHKKDRDSESKARTLRVDAARIDMLVNLTGELTVAKNSIGHAAKMAQDGGDVLALASMIKHRYEVLDRLVGELQRTVLALRVLPLNHVFQRFPRLLRELSHELGKPANLVIEGGETEADKAIVEMLFEPLLHVLRNSMDHGIENAAVRKAQGKPAVATITLRAYRQGEHVVVEVSDDGKGIDIARVRQVALERGVMSAETLNATSDADVVDVIFQPGFSTAGEVTGLSGRGVGMDAVRTVVQRLGGRVAVDAHAGQGTAVRFTLPFSVMMTQVMVVNAATQMFGVPLDAVVETVRMDANRIAPIGGAHAIVLRDRTIPLISLAETLGMTSTVQSGDEATVVITKVDGQYGALRVDGVGERMEVMLKPLDGLLAGMRGLAGSTLLGDGSVLLVLDIEGLFQ